MEALRLSPPKNRFRTPSGKIEIFSKTIDSFNYEDCPGHPTWIEPQEWLGSSLTEKFPIQLISGQPANRLHSQLDNGTHSRKSKVKGREAVTLNSKDAIERGIIEGDIVEIFNDRGRCLAGALISEEVMPNVAFLPTGAWYHPIDGDSEGRFCNHGNPNVLTRDFGTSKLAQGPIAHSTLVEIKKRTKPLEPISIFNPPIIENN